MKKTPLRGLLLSVIAILVFCNVNAPHAVAAEVGIKGGFQGIDGFKAGGFLTFDLGESFKLQPEIYFSQRKYRFTGYTPWGSPGDTHLYDNTRYIEIPLLLKYVANVNGSLKPVLFTGGFAAFRISSEYRYEEISYIQRRYKSLDGGLIVGAGFEFHKKNVKFHLDFRFNMGLGNIQQLDPYMIEAFADLEIYAEPVYNKNRSLALTLGISF